VSARDDPDAGHGHQSSCGLISLGQPSDSRIQRGLLVANTLMNRKQTFDVRGGGKIPHWSGGMVLLRAE
jgi:hypothetical protein